MASIKCEGLTVGAPIEIVLREGWLLQIDKNTNPTTFTIYHGKKSMSFDSDTMDVLCRRQYGLRLAKGRRQMKLEPEILDALVEYAPVIQWLEGGACDPSNEQPHSQ